MDLHQLQKTLEAQDVAARYYEVSSDTPLAYLAIPLSGKLELQLLYVPGLEKKLPKIRLLQIFVALPIETTKTARPEVLLYLAHINADLPLMSFNFSASAGPGGLIYFRYVLALGREPAPQDADVILQSISLSHYLVDRYSPPIAKVARGTASSAQQIVNDETEAG